MHTVEAFAHEMRGGITLFFLFWCFKLYPSIHRSRMMRLLFISTLWVTIGHLKDAVFLFEDWKDSVWLDNVTNVIDLIFIPLTCAFFLEATRPGFSTTPRVAIAVGVQALFIPAYLLWPTDGVLMSAYYVAYAMGVLTTASVIHFTARYHRYLSTHYSYVENLDVHWVVVSCLAFFSLLIIYNLAFDQTSWLSEALYNLYSLVLWTFLFVYAKRHKALRWLQPKRTNETQSAAAATQCVLEERMDSTEPDALEERSEGECIEEEEAIIESDEETSTVTINEEQIARQLTEIMTQRQLYLNPKLTLKEVAAAIGTNMTYLSIYLNHYQHLTFYDYVNRFRVEEACHLIDEMSSTGRINMTEVAQRSGFNSVSTFNRNFKKTKGITPKEYYFK